MTDEEIYQLIRDGDYCMPPAPTGKELLTFARTIEQATAKRCAEICDKEAAKPYGTAADSAAFIRNEYGIES